MNKIAVEAHSLPNAGSEIASGNSSQADNIETWYAGISLLAYSMNVFLNWAYSACKQDFHQMSCR
jgi:hypothetical protein